MCGEKVYLSGNGKVGDTLKWIKPEFHDKYRVFHEGKKKAEIHHIVSCEKLITIAHEISKEIPDEKLRRQWFYKLAAMLMLDTNNLTTLCMDPCHDRIHSKKTVKTNTTHKLLDDFINIIN